MRKSIFAFALIASSISAGPNPALANGGMTVLYNDGAWTAMLATKPGTPICMMFAGKGQKTLGYTSIQNTNYIGVQLIKKSWSIPPKTAIRLQLQVDNDPPWMVKAVGSGNHVAWPIQGKVLRSFSREFSRGHELIITFEGGNEPPWIISLNGSAGALSAFRNCIQDTELPPAPTQPFTPTPTQPYSPRAHEAPHPRQPSQPYPHTAPTPQSAPSGRRAYHVPTAPRSEPGNIAPPPSSGRQV